MLTKNAQLTFTFLVIIGLSFWVHALYRKSSELEAEAQRVKLILKEEQRQRIDAQSTANLISNVSKARHERARRNWEIATQGWKEIKKLEAMVSELKSATTRNEEGITYADCLDIVELDDHELQ